MKQYIHLLSVLLMTLLLATACQSARESVPQANTDQTENESVPVETPQSETADTTPKLQIVMQGEMSQERADYINEVLKKKGFGYAVEWICKSDLAPLRKKKGEIFYLPEQEERMRNHRMILR